ncbi:MAG TPA: VOC family protein [Gemmatimonadales bacterium]|nr:VOC family protein [Gemmatimonadales bacterium]HUK73336.1 VOC family protein [Streptosporangiaceae bacterium]
MSPVTELLLGRALQVSLTVKDLQKSVTWYVDVVGFKTDRRIERDGQLRGMALSAGDVRIILNQDDGAKGWERTKGEGFSLQLSTTQDPDAIARWIKERGGALEMEPKDMPWGARVFRLRDPDGYRWAISASR